MATVDATINDLRLEGQALVCTITLTGDAGGYGNAMMLVYDGSGVEHGRTDLGSMWVGQPWDANLDLPHSLPDGDYGAWIYVNPTASDGQAGQQVQQGISFLVGRGHIFPSTEAPDERTHQPAPAISFLRLEGTWIVFDMINHESFDVEVVHELTISDMVPTDVAKMNGRELVRAGATQQAHYLLPDTLADGKYLVDVMVSAEGSDRSTMGMAEIEVDGAAVTLVKTGL